MGMFLRNDIIRLFLFMRLCHHLWCMKFHLKLPCRFKNCVWRLIFRIIQPSALTWTLHDMMNKSKFKMKLKIYNFWLIFNHQWCHTHPHPTHTPTSSKHHSLVCCWSAIVCSEEVWVTRLRLTPTPKWLKYLSTNHALITTMVWQ